MVEPGVVALGVVEPAGGVTSGVVVAGAGVAEGPGMVFTGGEVGVTGPGPAGGGAAAALGVEATAPAEVAAPVFTPAPVALGVVTERSGEAVSVVVLDDECVRATGRVVRVVLVALCEVVLVSGPAEALAA